MPKFRKKPVEIEAVQFLGRNMDEVSAFVGEQLMKRNSGGYDCLVIPTLEGEHIAAPGDWIIRGIAGECYPCKPDIFAATYEPVDAG